MNISQALTIVRSAATSRGGTTDQSHTVRLAFWDRLDGRQRMSPDDYWMLRNDFPAEYKRVIHARTITGDTL